MTISENGEDFINDVLSHHGIRGMRWGVRKAENLGKPSRAERKAVKAENKSAKRNEHHQKIQDVKWWAGISNKKQYAKVYNAAADRVNAKGGLIEQINAKYSKYPKGALTKDATLREKYYNEYFTGFQKVLNEESAKAFPTSPSGKYRATMLMQDNGFPRIVMEPTEVTHSIEDGKLFIDFEFDEDGFITQAIFPPMDEMMQSALGEEAVQDILEHHGIKGMKWGVRKSESVASARAKLANMSDDELRKAIDRMRMEQQYSELSQGGPKKKVVDGHAFVKKFFDRLGDVAVGAVVTLGTAKIGKEFAKRAAKKAAQKTVGL